MITPEEERYIRAHAYVPEHSVGLMTCVSGGEPYLVDGYFCCRRKDWLIVVGYPLEKDFVLSEFEVFIDNIKKKYRPEYLSLIAPELSPSIIENCRERESDHYYILDLQSVVLKTSLRRTVAKAQSRLIVERSSEILGQHKALMKEFVENVDPPSRVKTLLFKTPEYFDNDGNAMVLNAWDQEENLSAFYIVDLEPEDFSTYVIGCHSKKDYVPGASDLLLFETVRLSEERGKKYVHLGLGVNEGIRRFKMKWGSQPTLKYEMCELVLKKPSIRDTILALQRSR
ncbi:MAG: hypothetical protein JSV50_04095 [Desulfobacteraceae bacterium]|nr:MAG: hypothetical protein JSV50_04095 [Desulfobacteraceae bacterium]